MSYLGHSIFHIPSVVLLSLLTVSLVVFMTVLPSYVSFLIWGSQTPNQGHFISRDRREKAAFGIHNKHYHFNIKEDLLASSFDEYSM